jgi:hypothetical protein
MRPIAKKAMVVAGVYLGLWGLTWWYAPSALQRQIYKEAVPDWREYRGQREERRKSASGAPVLPDLPIYEHGPVAHVDLLACPAAFVIKVDCARHIGGLNGYMWLGWYFVTPWRIYQISGEVYGVS